MAYIFAANSMGLSSFKFSWWALCSRVRIGRSRSSKVVDFGINRKRVCNFLLVINSNLPWFYLAPFLRYIDSLTENCEFFLPRYHLKPSLGVNPFEFLDDLFIAKTRLCVCEDFVILACVVFTYCQLAMWQTDDQTDGWTDRRRDGQLDRS